MVGPSPSRSNVVDSINNLDAGNPLHVQNIDNINSVIIPFNLLGTENYIIWSGAITLALQARNKYGFVDGTCLKESYSTSEVLSAQWDRCNAMVLTWIMNVVSQDVYRGLVYSKNVVVVWKELNETYDKVDGSIVYKKINIVKQGGSSTDYYHRLNSLWREFDALTKLPKCTCEVNCSCDASKELRLHQQLMKLVQFLMGLDDCYQPVRRKQSFNANSDVKMSDKSSSFSLSSGFTSEQIQKLLNMINEKPSGSIHANMAGRASFFNGNIIDYGANQHLTGSVTRMNNVVDILETDIHKRTKNKAKNDKTEHGFGKSAKKQSQGYKYLNSFIWDILQLEWVTTGDCLAGLHEFVVTKTTIETIKAASEENRRLWRVSSTLFCAVASDTVMKPLGHFAQSSLANRYSPVYAGEYFKKELAVIKLNPNEK
ncbi:ribonuclease H-like domain-containing protein [Tanacetum coccineum]